MSESKIFIAIGAITFFLLASVILLAGTMNKTAKVEANSDVKVEVAATSYDWGEIGINNGKVDAFFEIKNAGKQTLKLFNITTSCACTNAQTIVDDKSSPLFGMHTKSDYVTNVEPGKTAKVKVAFDPLFHGPNGLGKIDRQVTVTTNDPTKPTITLYLSAQVIK